MKRFISIVLSFMICFTCIFELSANAYMLNSQIVSNEDENVIQSMLDKLGQILGLLNKKGSITVECIDDNESVLSSNTYKNLKYGTYSYSAPDIEDYVLNDEDTKSVTISKQNKNPKITFKYIKNVQQENTHYGISKPITIPKQEEEFVENELPFIMTNGFTYEWLTNESIKYEIYCSDYDQEDVRIYQQELEHFTLHYKVINSNNEEIINNSIDAVAGDNFIEIGQLPEGIYQIEFYSEDSYGRLSTTIFNEFRVIETREIPEEQTYRMTAEDLDKYNISNEKSKVETTLSGLQQLLNDTKEAGYRKIVLLQGTYLFDENNTLYIPDRFTVDMNQCTFKLNPNGLANCMMVRLRDTFDSHLINGTIEGDINNHNYAGNDKNSEWVNGAEVCGTSKYSTIENVEIKDITGYGLCVGMRNTDYLFKSKSINKFEKNSDNNWINSEFYSLDGYPGFIQCGLYLGYQGNPTGDSWYYKAHFYDENYDEIETTIGYYYRKLVYPKNAKYFKLETLKVENDSEITSNIQMFAFKIPENCGFINDTINNCRCVGLAMSANNNFMVDNCYFTKNGLRGAHCALDAEDGWDMMHGSWFKNNTFENNYNNDFLTCGGHNFVNENQKGNVYLWERTRNYLVRNLQSGNIVRAAYTSLIRTGYTRIENINNENGTIHAENQVVRNCNVKSIFTGSKGAAYRCSMKKIPENSYCEDSLFTLDNFSSYIPNVKLKNCTIQPSEGTTDYGMSFNKLNAERVFENCDFKGKVSLNHHNQFNSGDFVNCRFEDLKIAPGVINNDEIQEIKFIKCEIQNSTFDYFIRFSANAYDKGYTRLVFRDCDITTNNTGESMIYMHSSPMMGSYVKFENCNLENNDRYYLSGYYSVKNNNNPDQALEINFTGTKIDESKIFNLEKGYDLYPDRFKIVK